MPSNVFASIAPLLKEKKYHIDNDVVENFISHYQEGQWIYPDVMHRRLQLDYEIVYDVLELYTENNYLERYVRLLCPACHRYTGPFYKTLLDIPLEMGCDYDDELIENPQKYMRVVYKVKKHEQ